MLDRDAPPQGTYFLHESGGTQCQTTFGAPPHGGLPLVEHNITSASDPSLVGKTVLQQWALSADGEELTTTDMQMHGGHASIVEQLEWRRITL